MFELRPSNQSGLLLHVGNSDHHLTVFMRKGEVRSYFKFKRGFYGERLPELPWVFFFFFFELTESDENPSSAVQGSAFEASMISDRIN